MFWEELGEVIQKIIETKLGTKFLTMTQDSLEACYRDSVASVPLVFIISPGSDPMNSIESLARLPDIDMINSIVPVSLGQGQGPRAISEIKKGSGWQEKGAASDNTDVTSAGKWVLLQNCHLAPSFMGTLSNMVEAMAPEPPRFEKFRLWITACPSPSFPILVLNLGIKMTCEPPQGLRSALVTGYEESKINQEFLDSCTQKPQEFQRLLFGLIFFHALILARRDFGPLGWNKPYQFSDPDCSISKNQLLLFLSEKDEIPYPALIYMVAQANYGGRITEDKDRTCIETILRDFYNPNVIKDGHKICCVQQGAQTIEYVVPVRLRTLLCSKYYFYFTTFKNSIFSLSNHHANL